MTIHFSLFSAPYPQLTQHYPRFTNQQLTNYEPLPTTTTHYFFYFQYGQHSLLHALFPLRPTSPSACDLMSRKFLLSRVLFIFVLYHLDNTSARHIHTTPSQSTHEKSTILLFFSVTQHSLSFLFTIQQFTTHNSQFKTHNLSLPTNKDNVFCFTPFHLFDQQVVTWWIASFSSACRVCFVCFFTVLPHLDNTSASHIHTTPSPINAWKNLLTYNSQITASCSLFKTHCSVLISHFSTTHCSQFTTHSTQLTTHSSLLTSNEDNVLCFTPFYLFFVQQVHQHVTWWIASFSFACRVWFVSSLFCLISISQTHAIFIQHPSHQRVEKKNSQLIPLQTTHYSLLVTLCAPHNTTYSLITAHWQKLLVHSYLLTTHCSLFTYLFLYTHHSPSTIFLTTHSHCSLLNTYDLQLITQYLLVTTDNALLATHHSLHFFLLLTTHYPLPIIRILVNHNSRFTTHH